MVQGEMMQLLYVQVLRAPISGVRSQVSYYGK